MGTSVRSVSFVDSSMTLDVHSATHACDLRVMTIDEFSGGWGIISIEEEIETGDITVTRLSGDFITGSIV
jgi:hypothetical protein